MSFADVVLRPGILRSAAPAAQGLEVSLYHVFPDLVPPQTTPLPNALALRSRFDSFGPLGLIQLQAA